MKWKETKKYIWIVVLVVLLIALDQGTKIILQANSYTENKGISAIISDIIVIAMVLRFMIVQRDKMYKTTQISLSLILAGGIGNLIDKIFRGKIINFIDLSSFIPKFPTFNLAYIFIVIGFIMFVIIAAINTFGLVKGKGGIHEKTNTSM